MEPASASWGPGEAVGTDPALARPGEQVARSWVGARRRAVFVTFEPSLQPIQAPQTTCLVSKESSSRPPPPSLPAPSAQGLWAKRWAKRPSLGARRFASPRAGGRGEVRGRGVLAAAGRVADGSRRGRFPFPHSRHPRPAGGGGGERAGDGGSRRRRAGRWPCPEQTRRPRAPLGHLPGHLPALGSGCARAGSGVSDVC